MAAGPNAASSLAPAGPRNSAPSPQQVNQRSCCQPLNPGRAKGDLVDHGIGDLRPVPVPADRRAVGELRPQLFVGAAVGDAPGADVLLVLLLAKHRAGIDVAPRLAANDAGLVRRLDVAGADGIGVITEAGKLVGHRGRRAYSFLPFAVGQQAVALQAVVQGRAAQAQAAGRPRTGCRWRASGRWPAGCARRPPSARGRWGPGRRGRRRSRWRRRPGPAPARTPTGRSPCRWPAPRSGRRRSPAGARCPARARAPAAPAARATARPPRPGRSARSTCGRTPGPAAARPRAARAAAAPAARPRRCGSTDPRGSGRPSPRRPDRGGCWRPGARRPVPAWSSPAAAPRAPAAPAAAWPAPPGDSSPTSSSTSVPPLACTK